MKQRPFFIIFGESRSGKTSFGLWLSVLSFGKFSFLDSSKLYLSCSEIPAEVKERVKLLSAGRLLGTPTERELTRQNLKSFYQTYGYAIRHRATQKADMYIGARTTMEVEDLLLRCKTLNRLPVLVEVVRKDQDFSLETMKFFNEVAALKETYAALGFIFINRFEDSWLYSKLLFIYNVWKLLKIMQQSISESQHEQQIPEKT